MKVIVYIIAVLSLLTSVSAHAEWSKDFSVDYIMGDGDNRTSARQAALEQLKLKASGEAGTYIQSTTTMHSGGDLSENVQMIGASMVKVSNIKDKMSINPSGQSLLTVTARASIDESELTRRVEAMQQDKEKARQIKVLQAENDDLFRELKKIRAALASGLDASRTAELITQQDSAVRRLSSNSQTITQVFERGTLLQLAGKNTDDFTRAKIDLDENFFPLIMKTPVSAVIESVEDAGKDGYVALVRVGWEFDNKKLQPALSRYLTVNKYGNSEQISISAYSNVDAKGPSVLSEKIYKYLGTKGIDLKLKLAGKEVTLPVFFSGNAFSDICGYYGDVRKGENKYLCLVSQNIKSTQVHGLHSGMTNPIRIPLTREEAERATRVEAAFF